jgi:hypothetical protein
MRIRFANLVAREKAALATLEAEQDRLVARRTKRGDLAESERAELDRIDGLVLCIAELRKNAELKKSEFPAGAYVDPLFSGVRHAFQNDDSFDKIVIEHDNDGFLIFEKNADAERLQVRVALTLGYLELDGVALPRLAVSDKPPQIAPDKDDPASKRLSQAFYVAMGEVKANFDLAKRVLPILATAGNVTVREGGDDGHGTVSSLEFARVMRALASRGVAATETQLPRQVDKALDTVQNVGAERPLHELGIKLPDLDQSVDDALVADNISLAGSAIFASMFEELKAFQVLDKLVDMSQRGTLPIGRGPAGTQLYRYWRDAPTRMSESERQTFYAMTLGIPGGPPDININTDFNDLWMRFVSSVTLLTREDRIDRLIRASSAASGGQQQVRKAARDLAYNLSSRGYGMSYYVAQDLSTQINEMIELLSSETIKSAFGARDMWQVIDQVAALELGGARNSSKYRTLATCGAIITAWLAKNTERMSPSFGGPIIDLTEVQSPPPRRAGETATSHPNDYDVVNACELWIADTAVPDERIEEMGQPRESPQGPSRPIQIPSMARELLDQAGISLGMSNGGGSRRGAPNRYGSY